MRCGPGETKISSEGQWKFRPRDLGLGTLTESLPKRRLSF